jgi:choline transport protein
VCQLTGWTSTIAWQAGNALGIFIVGSLIQTIILVNDESYTFPNWQGTLLACAAMVTAYIGNVYGSRILPYWQIPVFIIHILAYFAFIVPVWVKAPAATHSQVWRDFSNHGGWSSIGLSIMIGQLSGISQQTGIDTAAHMSEEVKNAAKTIPRTMLSVYVINMCLIFPAIITIVYHIPDLDAALEDSTTYPALYVLKQTMSVGWMTALMVVICMINMCSNIVYLAAVTRDLFAFSRDKGLPFSKWLSTVHPTRHIPVNAAKFTCVTAFALALIYIGSKHASPAKLPEESTYSHLYQVLWHSTPSPHSPQSHCCNATVCQSAAFCGGASCSPRHSHQQNSRLDDGASRSMLWPWCTRCGPSSGHAGHNK